MVAKPTTLSVSSPTLQPGDPIPAEYTADGRDVSPPLNWADVPHGSASLVLICEDPDAPRGLFTHWVAFNLPAGSRGLGEAFPTSASLPDGVAQATTDFGRTGYGGPAPPPGKPHRYFFRLFALDTRLDLDPGASHQEVRAAMEGHILAEGEFMGTYGRAAPK
ncbi:YbhB/YbcL family Raf kinase inhibitor-like protein [Fimbriiglobus ruber]|uniref:Phospholipid-binding protein n=1 Tax=Fimbriiglobus ruber TaxID=1908690 RepID=A0A225DJN6_9BACT|nr:YbhB/YbcL family Raf kinase inhibitor-like protein [Fimbriiglobus ruber]OWK36347.1 hypothetical protein FRUB_08910 [Fimbriiglobus ruber]